MVIARGAVCWLAAGEEGRRQPVLVVQEDEFNASRLPTVICATISSNLKLAHAPGNVFVSRKATGLDKDGVVDVARLQTVSKDWLSKPVGKLAGRLLREVNDGLRLVLSL